MLGIYVAGCAGGHLNPAITFVNCMFRGFPWKKWPAYACAQVAGCFCGAVSLLSWYCCGSPDTYSTQAVIYGNYKSAIDQYEGGVGIRTVPGYSETATAGVFCTYPQPFLTTTGMFFSEFIASAMLVMVIFALKDDANLGAGNLVPLGLFFLIFGLGATLGWETGYAINLARDFGPRLFTYFVGYGSEVWSAGNYYFWVCGFKMWTGALLTLLDPHDCTISGMYIWRLLVRPSHLHWRKPNQYSMDGSEESSPT
jgi:aquaglyceroporin related protein, other eukaryote